jgi:hypothetical protein
MRPEQSFFIGLAIPLALAFGVWLGVDCARRFHLKLERHGVRLANWHRDTPAEQATTAPVEELV